jgi:NodT family efflux transporter outer membrane factor (OMF) lipoprotein
VKLRLFGIVVAACAAGACSLAPTYTKPTIDAPQAFKETGPWQTAAPADELDASDWWHRYGDATLDELEAKVDAANPDLAAAEERYALARGFVGEATSGLFPRIDATDLSTKNRQSDNRPLRSASQPAEYEDRLLGAQLGYELDLWGRVRNLVAASRANAQASKADLASVRLSLHAELANAYISLRGLDAQQKLLDDTVAAYEQALKLTKNRLEGGIASGLDVSRAQTQLGNALALRTDVRAQRALYEHAIASLVGQTASTFSLQPIVADLPVPPVPTALPSTLLERRPDVAAAERRAAAANAQIGITRAAFFPNVSITATGGYENAGGTGWLTSPNSFWSLGPRITLPIFDAGLRSAREKEAFAIFNEASDRYRSTALTAFQQVEDNLALLHLLGEEAKFQSAAAASAQQTLNLALDRYRNGAVSYLDVVESQTAALQAQRSELALRVRQLHASVGLIRALGGGWHSDEDSASIASSDPSQH